MSVTVLMCPNCHNSDWGAFRTLEDRHSFVCRKCGAMLYDEGHRITPEQMQCQIGYSHLRNLDFERAKNTFSAVMERDEALLDAKWGYLLACFGIVYLTGYGERESKPTFCFAHYDVRKKRFRDDDVYRDLIARVRDEQTREIYEERAAQIDREIERIKRDLTQKSEYDVFICTKIGLATRHDQEVDRTAKTQDFAIAEQIYRELTEKRGLRVFCSEISKKGGIHYDSEIWSAMLRSQKILVIGTCREYLESVWVKSEWKRWMYLIEELGVRQNDSFISYIPDDADFCDIRPEEWDAHRVNTWTKKDYARMLDQLCEGCGAGTKKTGEAARIDFREQLCALRTYIIDGKTEDAEKLLARLERDRGGSGELRMLRLRLRSQNFTNLGLISDELIGQALRMLVDEKIEPASNREYQDYLEAKRIQKQEARKSEAEGRRQRRTRLAERRRRQRQERLEAIGQGIGGFFGTVGEWLFCDGHWYVTLAVLASLLFTLGGTAVVINCYVISNTALALAKAGAGAVALCIVGTVVICVIANRACEFEVLWNWLTGIFSVLGVAVLLPGLIGGSLLVSRYQISGDGVIYYLDRSGAVVCGISQDAAEVTVEASYSGYPVHKLRDGACQSDRAEHITVRSASALKVESRAFAGCDNLLTLRFEGGIIDMDGKAIRDCVKLESLTLDGVTWTPDKKAVRDCVKLREVALLNSTVNLVDEVFLNCPALAALRIEGTSLTCGESDDTTQYPFSECGTFDLYLRDCTVSRFSTSWDNRTVNTVYASGRVDFEARFYGDPLVVQNLVLCRDLDTANSRLCSISESGVFSLEREYRPLARRVFAYREATLIPGGIFGTHAGESVTVYYQGSEAEWQNVAVASENNSNYSEGSVILYCNAFEDEIPDVLLTGGTLPGNGTGPSNNGSGSTSGSGSGSTSGSGSGSTSGSGSGSHNSAYPDGISYEVHDGYAAVTGYDPAAGTYRIADFYQGLPVTHIASNAFSEFGGAEFPTIPNGITHIGAHAFAGATAANPVLPDSVQSIGEYAFSGCVNLTEVTFPDTLQTLGEYAFAQCENLERVGFAQNGRLQSIGDFAFSECPALTQIELPMTLQSIGAYAFENDTALALLVIPNSNTEIDGTAFSGCTGIRDATLAADALSLLKPSREVLERVYVCGGSELPSSALSSCPKLTRVILSQGIRGIGKSAFAGCTALTEITLPEGLMSIGETAFSECGNLFSITLPTTLSIIGDHAFMGCRRLVEVCNLSSLPITPGGPIENNGGLDFWVSVIRNAPTAPSCVFVQDGYVFYEQDGVYSLLGYVGSDTALYLPQRFNGAIYRINRYAFAAMAHLTAITIPYGVAEIGYAAFDGCSGLTSMTLPDSVTRLGSLAFEDCTGLRSIKLSAGLDSLDTLLFWNCTSLTEVVVPESVTMLMRGVFQNCTNLTRVVLSANVRYVMVDTFQNCPMLTIYCEASAPASGWDAAWNSQGYPVVWNHPYEQSEAEG